VTNTGNRFAQAALQLGFCHHTRTLTAHMCTPHQADDYLHPPAAALHNITAAWHMLPACLLPASCFSCLVKPPMALQHTTHQGLPPSVAFLLNCGKPLHKHSVHSGPQQPPGWNHRQPLTATQLQCANPAQHGPSDTQDPPHGPLAGFGLDTCSSLGLPAV
jgi:hypothetical protein